MTEDQRGTSWLSLLDPKIVERYQLHSSTADEPPRFVHFYGFKGGQGRSSALAAFATALANDGWRVLAIDFDAEAPSLDLIFGASTTDPAATVVGIRAAEQPRPVGLGATPRGGEVTILPFRPDSAAFDYDAAALAFELQNYPPVAEALATQLSTLSKPFDVVLIDHRTGLGPVVPALTRVLPGPVVVFAKMDGQSRHARRAVAGLWAVAASGGWLGVLVSLSPPDEDVEVFRSRTRGEAEDILQGLADAYDGSSDGEPRSAEEFVDNWIVWPFDNVLARNSGIAAMGPPCLNAISNIRRLLNLAETKTPILKKSGASDEGNLIVTQALRKLQAPNSPYTLIIGRKGTGKTRLVRALAEAGRGEPLLVPSDFPTGQGGVRAGNLHLKPLIERFRHRPELFWYVLMIAAMQGTTDSEPFLVRAEQVSTNPEEIFRELIKSAAQVSQRRSYLIDALESAFDHEDTFPFVRGLFRALETVDATPELSSAVQLRLFVRRDLVEQGIQNREQLEAGRRIDLVWDVQSIFNFALSRIVSLTWYRVNFPEAVRDIEERLPIILEGQLPVSECEELMLRIFPPKLSYKNMATLTFLRTYFSDDSTGDTSFYPRVYLLFLERLATVAHKSNVQRIDGRAIVQAHETASQEFLNEVSQELANAAAFDVPTLKRIFDQLNGKKTPFDVDELVASIAESVLLDAKQIRELFNVMRQLGVFEEYPKRPNQWRPGRLFKTALRMRFASGGG
ncbi:MAG TPA: cellulose synthase operon protein YhjQ/BcsQ [Thermoanaerobaculia bacterium]|jgi:hypothetical protein|nr:cellulose synthase operon protein YhjQ/BcsQ [Thermoanaerobaculia bacterium]